jgi:hypothetical protein
MLPHSGNTNEEDIMPTLPDFSIANTARAQRSASPVTAIFTFDGSEYISGLWFACSTKRDIMGLVWRPEGGDEPWIGRYRFRHYDPATMHKDPFTDNDRKTATTLTVARGRG